MLKVINYYSNKVDGSFEDIYTDLEDLRKDHPDAEVITGYGVHDTETGYSPNDAADWYATYDEAQAFIDAAVQEKLEEVTEGALITIQAKALITDGEVSGVRLTGVSALGHTAVTDIAYEAIDATYGSVSHNRVPIFTRQEWEIMRETEPQSITLEVRPGS